MPTEHLPLDPIAQLSPLASGPQVPRSGLQGVERPARRSDRPASHPAPYDAPQSLTNHAGNITHVLASPTSRPRRHVPTVGGCVERGSRIRGSLARRTTPERSWAEAVPIGRKV